MPLERNQRKTVYCILYTVCCIVDLNEDGRSQRKRLHFSLRFNEAFSADLPEIEVNHRA